MVSRQLEGWLRSVVDRPQVVHIMGMRQTGKTTMMESFRKQFGDSLHYPLHDLVTLRRYESQPENWVLELESEVESRRKRGRLPLHVFVDEVQKIPAFFQAIQGLYDKYKGLIKFWIWGSSAIPQKRRRAETLSGRALFKILWTLSQAELLEKESVVPLLLDPERLMEAVAYQEPRGYTMNLCRWLTHSMLPEPNQIESISQAQDLLLSIQATYLENEIRRENLIRDIGTFERFLSICAGESGNIANFLKMGSLLGISSHTVKSYYEILHDTFVCNLLPAFSKSLRVQVAKAPKMLFSDVGLARFVAGERGNVQKASVPFGRYVEGFAINEVLKQVEYQGLPWKLCYFRTRSGVEVDLVVSSNVKRAAIEIKGTSRLSPSDTKGIEKMMQLDPEIDHGIIFSLQAAPFEILKNIFNVPLWCL